MFTNAYPPHVGGVSISVFESVKHLKNLGHSVLVVTPDYPGKGSASSCDETVIRLQSIKNISGSNFSLPIPVSMELGEKLQNFSPEIIHSHYPFLVGDMALRYGARKSIPVVFTHHTRYESYEDLLPWDSQGFETFATELSAGYANLCNRVIAPTRGMAGLLRKNGVKTPVNIIPTGIDVNKFSKGEGGKLRHHYGIDPESFLIGHIGRLAPEKNLDFWWKAVCAFLEKHPKAHALIVGSGSCAPKIKKAFASRGLAGKLTMTGTLKGADLIDAYHAMDVFAFTSVRETQGLVLVEALAAGCPVVALDALCVRDVVSDGEDGHLVKTHSPHSFCDTLGEFAKMSEKRYKRMSADAQKNARRFSIDTCVKKTVNVYSELTHNRRPGVMESTGWLALGKLAGREVRLWKGRFKALINALRERVEDGEKSQPAFLTNEHVQ